MSPERWRQVEQLYHAALERDSETRPAFLSEACASDAELRREVESLLAQEDVALPELGTGDLLAPGTQMATYRIEAVLGQGGMGVVYRALDTKLSRPVAIKFLSHELVDTTTRRRFQREAQMASSLNHPHIVTVYDVGEWRGHQYLVTEYIDGGTLEDWVRVETRTWGQIVELLVGVADGLAVAHDAGILHRDIKPSNILVGKNGYAKLADFGLAKLAGDERKTTPGELRTQPGMVIGTVAYMSPEQASGSPLDARSDIFSFGVLLYELLAGRRPFEGATHLELLQTIIHRDAESLSPEVPPALRVAVEKALEKAPGERYQTMRELAVDMRRLTRQSGKSAALPAVGPAHDRISRGPSRKLALLLAGLSLAAALGYLGFSSFRPRPPAVAASVAVLPFADLSPARDQDHLCDGVVDSVTNALSKVPNLHVVARTSAFQFKGKSEDVRKIGRQLGVGTVLEGSLQRTGERMRITVQLVNTVDGYQLWSEMYDRPISDLLAIQDDIANRVASTFQVRLTGKPGAPPAKPYDNIEVYNLYLKGRYGPRNETAIGYFQQAIAKDPRFAPAWVGLAETYVELGALARGRPQALLGKAKEAATKALELDDNLPEAHLALARVKAIYEWDWPGGEREFRRALELNPGHVEARMGYATYLSYMGRSAEAIEQIERIRLLDPLSPSAAGSQVRIFFLARQYDRAIEHARAAMAAFPEAWQTGEYWLGRSYAEKGMLAEAILAMEQNRKMRPDRTQGFGMLAVVYARAGRKNEAAMLLAEAENLAKTTYVSPVSMAQTCAAIGQMDRAFHFLDQAYLDRDHSMALLKVEPAFDPFRQDPRFQDLLKRVRLQ
ncbi:MAG: protein kinase domain-containing protein [Bryobacteraceae bacterium]